MAGNAQRAILPFILQQGVFGAGAPVSRTLFPWLGPALTVAGAVGATGLGQGLGRFVMDRFGQQQQQQQASPNYGPFQFGNNNPLPKPPASEDYGRKRRNELVQRDPETAFDLWLQQQPWYSDAAALYDPKISALREDAGRAALQAMIEGAATGQDFDQAFTSVMNRIMAGGPAFSSVSDLGPYLTEVFNRTQGKNIDDDPVAFFVASQLLSNPRNLIELLRGGGPVDQARAMALQAMYQRALFARQYAPQGFGGVGANAEGGVPWWELARRAAQARQPQQQGPRFPFF
jgi:hypothetical protein